MSDHQQIIQTFFSKYEANFNNALKDMPILDISGIVKSFARYFVGTSPAGIQGGKNGFLFRFMIRRGYAFYRKMGIKTMKIEALQITPLDEFHVMTKVRWKASYCKRIKAP